MIFITFVTYKLNCTFFCHIHLNNINKYKLNFLNILGNSKIIILTCIFNLELVLLFFF